MSYTAKKHEEHLNNLYADAYTEQEAIDNLCYLNQGKIKPATIARYHRNHELGTLIRRLDPIAFFTGLHEKQATLYQRRIYRKKVYQ